VSSAPAGQPPLLNIANVLTGIRLLLVPVFLAALLVDDGTDAGWRLIAFGVFAVAAITDRFDGELARRRGLVTAFGTFIDPVADKALIGAALVGLSLLGLVPWWATVVIMGREIGVTVLRMWVLRHGIIPASRGGKAKTFVQMLAIGLFLLPLPDVLVVGVLRWTVLAVAIGLTAVTGVDYVLRGLRLRKATATATEPT
jgi:CDP-diacylglycerol---glycerol-3-phosphate 3-phosphatidyltransferase